MPFYVPHFYLQSSLSVQVTHVLSRFLRIGEKSNCLLARQYDRSPESTVRGSQGGSGGVLLLAVHWIGYRCLWDACLSSPDGWWDGFCYSEAAPYWTGQRVDVLETQLKAHYTIHILTYHLLVPHTTVAMWERHFHHPPRGSQKPPYSPPHPQGMSSP